jgi:hypothetical protein
VLVPGLHVVTSNEVVLVVGMNFAQIEFVEFPSHQNPYTPQSIPAGASSPNPAIASVLFNANEGPSAVISMALQGLS